MGFETRCERRFWFFVIIIYFTVGYLSLNYLNQFRSYYYDVLLGSDLKIPYIPLFVLGYILVYFSIALLYFLVQDAAVFRRSVVSFLAVTTAFYLIFILFPVKMMLRPDLSQVHGIFNGLTEFYYVIDLPCNCFPSLHVAYPFLGALVLWNYKRVWSYIYLCMTVLIAISVLFVKQHYIIDVVAAPVVALIVYALVAGLVGLRYFSLEARPKLQE